MDLRKAISRTTLSAEGFAAEFGDEPQIWTVEKVYQHQFPDDAEPTWIAKFMEHPWAISLSGKRATALGYAAGTFETDAMPGHQVRLRWEPATNPRGPCKSIVIEPPPEGHAKPQPKKSWRPDQGGE